MILREMRWLFVAVLVVLPEIIWGQDGKEVEAVETLLGVDVEELDEDEYDRMCGYIHRPLQLNVASPQELSSSGMLTRFQVASLIDYRKRNGSLMSFMELASVDGFGEEFVMRLRPFVSIYRSEEVRGALSRHDVTLRSSYRNSDSYGRWGYAFRYRIRTGNQLSCSLAFSRSLDASEPFPDAFCGSLIWKSRNAPVKIIIGDFNARFAQGLNLWSGMYISDYSSPSSFLRRSSGVTATSSFTGTGAYTGTAVELLWGRCSFSLMAASAGLKKIRSQPQRLRLVPAANLTYNGRFVQYGITHSMAFGGFDNSSDVHIPSMNTSMDFSACFKGVDVFSEISHDWVSVSQSMVAGTVFPFGDAIDLAAMLRLSDEEYAVCASGSLSCGKWIRMAGKDVSDRRISGTFSSDLVLYQVPKSSDQDRSLQLKFRTQWKLALSESWMLSLRIYERVRSWGDRFRTDIRTDLSWSDEKWMAVMRLNMLRCRSASFLGYVEGGMKGMKMTVHLRQGIFVVDRWEDRIYAYERDAPGCFNVPAFYGRGIWTSLTAALKLTGWCRIYLRGSYTSYLLMKEKKPGRAELRFQCMLDL